jgi:hypothetical protein
MFSEGVGIRCLEVYASNLPIAHRFKRGASFADGRRAIAVVGYSDKPTLSIRQRVKLPSPLYGT